MTDRSSRTAALRYELTIRMAVLIARFALYLSPERIALLIERIGRDRPLASSKQVHRIRDTVCAVSRRCAGLGCLQRSIAVVLACRWFHGSVPDWCAGFALEPFTAHAWVEVNGTPIGEPAKISTYYVMQSARFSSAD